MSFQITNIKKVVKDNYKDIFFGSGIVEVKDAPIAAFFDIEVLIESKNVVFEAEIRQGKVLSVDWSDEFQNLLMEHSKSEEDWNLITETIFCVFENQIINFPLKIGIS